VFGASIWRSHLLVRQWLRLASRRRLNVATRIFASLLLVHYVAGYGTLAADPWWKMAERQPIVHTDYVADTDTVLRFFALSTAYLLVGR